MAPWSNPVVGRRTSPFGPRPPLPWHGGFDIAPPTPGERGLLVRAASVGVVQAARENALKGHTGLGVVLDHGNVTGVGPTRTYYGHLQEFRVRVGEKVKTGQVLGVMGDTGNAYGVHLHYGVLIKGQLVDPDPFMRARGVRLGLDAPLKDDTASWAPAVLPELINARLRLAGYHPAGRPGDYDRSQVLLYQQRQLYPTAPRLTLDGLWGPETEGHYCWTVELQQALERLGGRLNIDGDLQTHTVYTLTNAQRALGLVPDGVPGPRTCAALGIREHP